KTYNLYDNAIFQTKVTELRWLEDEARWLISTDREDAIRAKYVVHSTGPLNRPKLPAIPGIEDYKGHTFHTSRWDYEYTGGDHSGGLTNLADKRVAVIGTGATTIQAVPFVGKHAKEMFVFQRTPSSVDVRGNKPTDQEWAKTLKPGWQRERRENFNDMVIGRPVKEDMVNDGWTEIFRTLASMIPTDPDKPVSPEEAAALAELADFKKMNGIRDRVSDTVSDDGTAETLRPWYRQFCKRPTFNDDYLPTFNLPNVTLVDTSDTKGVERITETGIETGGKTYEVDCIIFATGFEVGTAYTRRSGFDIVGEGGQKLSDYWADGLRTLHGFSSHGFPNCFQVGFSQNGFSVNLTSVLDDQAQHVAYLINEIDARGARSAQPSEEAEAEWVATIRKLAVANTDFFEACTPGYYNNEGNLEARRGVGAESYAPGANAFNQVLKEWRETGELPGLELN
ncbi:MAG: monooxygenase, partial [Gammaproteobacteria bacterium]|nr:monooxygenase [Gammaproteobacteria bacterium]